MSVYRPKTSRFYRYDFYVMGHRFQGSTKRTTKRAAEQVEEAERRKQLDRLQLGASDTCTVAEGLGMWLKGADISELDRRGCGFKVRRWLELLPPKMSFADLTLAHVNRALSRMRQEGWQRRGKAGSYSPATLNGYVRVLQAATSYARTHGYAAPTIAPWPSFKHAPKLRWLTPEEELAVLDRLQPAAVLRRLRERGHNHEANADLTRRLVDQYHLTVFLLDTGCRYSEAAGVPWDAVDTTTFQWINIYRHKVGNESLLQTTDRLRAVLRERWEDPHRRGAYIFPGRNGRQHRGYATKGIQRALNEAGCNAEHLVARFGRATPHTFRDTFAARLAQAGVSLYKVQKLLGHSNPQQTQKYAHLAPEQGAAEAAAVLNALHTQNGGSRCAFPAPSSPSSPS